MTKLAIAVALIFSPAHQAVRSVFAPDGPAVQRQAVRVAGCESAGDPSGRVLRPYATNGQYLGLFQLGAWARGRYLRGPWYSAWANARAARRLWIANGRDWGGQWECSWAAYR
jgi:hypothetical protein